MAVRRRDVPSSSFSAAPVVSRTVERSVSMSTSAGASCSLGPITGDEMAGGSPKNIRATFRGTSDRILVAHCRLITAISAEEGL